MCLYCTFHKNCSGTYNFTCFSIKRIVSSETPSLDFLTFAKALERTLLTDSLALLLNCLASLARFSLCSRKTHLGTGTLMMVPSTSGFSFMLLSCRARVAAAVLVMFTTMSCGDFMEIWPSWFRGNFPSLVVTVMWSSAPVRMPRLRLKSSFSVASTVAISSFTSSRLMMSSTRAALMLTLAAWPFAFAAEQWRD
uniref:Uncharacterized protein n=1 Tax=Pygocentrus nattereri TaxID=42514 RepID=A0A3B4CMB7_PYGNA